MSLVTSCLLMAVGRQSDANLSTLVYLMDLYLIRHAHAGSRTDSPHDKYRPCSDKGHLRAASLKVLFDDIKIDSVLSSTATRCVQTVEPLAASKNLEVIENELLWEGSSIPDVLGLLKSLAKTRTVLCSHGDIIPGVIDTLGNNGVPIQGRGCEKGSIWVISFDGRKAVGARHVSKKATSLDG